MAKQKKPKSPGKGGHMAPLLLILCAIGGAVAMPRLASQVVVLLAPALGLLTFDGRPGRPLGRAAVLFGAATSVPWLADGMVDDWSPDSAAIVAAWLAQGMAVAIASLAPLGIRAMLEVRDRATVERLRTERNQLARTWGVGEETGSSMPS